MEFKTVSLADRVFETLEKEVLDGKYPRGLILSEKRLSNDLGVSRTPIREALNRMREEDLVEDTTAGTMVVGMTEADVRDVYEVRRRVEVLASRRAAVRITEDQLEQMKTIIEQQEFFASKGTMERVRDLDTEFHDLMYDASGSRVLKRILRSLHHKVMWYRKESLLSDPKRMHNSIEEHHAIYDALVDRDGDKVETLMLVHLEHAYNSTMKVIGMIRERSEQNPGTKTE